MFELKFCRHLTERQKEILIENNLPDKWMKLNTSQRQSIVAIEEMLEYLENKYNKKFCYAGYKPKNELYLDEEALLAYAEGDNPDTDKFSVKRTEAGFEDSYDWVLAAPGIQKEAESIIDPILYGQTYKMFTEINGMDEDGNPTLSDVLIFIENGDAQKCDSLFEEIVESLGKDNRIGDVFMYCFDKAITSQMNAGNYNDCFSGSDTRIFYQSYRRDRDNNCKWERR